MKSPSRIKISRKKSFDISSIEDPAAQETSWKPLQKNSKKKQTHKLIEIASDQLEFKRTFDFSGMIIISLMVIVVMHFTNERIALSQGIAIIAIGALFKMNRFFRTANWFFDRKSNSFYNTQTKNNSSNVEQSAQLVSVQAIQIIKKATRNSGNKRTLYELNFIMLDSSRTAIISIFSRQKIVRDAERLGAFLSVPVWKNFS